jgi:hypothetical protein
VNLKVLYFEGLPQPGGADGETARLMAQAGVDAPMAGARTPKKQALLLFPWVDVSA